MILLIGGVTFVDILYDGMVKVPRGELSFSQRE
jgi:hypothetical protein